MVMFDMYHADCLDVLRGFDDESVDAVVTDPPYGVSYQSARRTDRTQWKPKIANDGHPFIWWLHDAFRITKDGGALVCFCEWRHQEVFRMAIQAAGFTIKSQTIWDRDWHGMGDLTGAFAPQHDVVWFATKGKFKFPGKRPKSVMRYRRVSAEALVHPTEKPVDLMRHLVASVCPSGGTVLDPFAGSGATGVAALMEGRDFIGIERDDEYFRIAAERIALVHKEVA